MKRTLAICLTLVMLISSFAFTGVTASAMAGGGLPTTVTYSFGCDLSTWNVDGASTLNHSLVDFDKMYADGCEFAILRIGFEGSSTGANTMDKAFLRYYEEARAAGMKLGVYFYALGTTYDEAVDDAKWVISVIEENNMYFEYPIYYDVEEDDQVALSRTNYTNLCLGWCETMEAAGYLPGVYATLTNINNKLTDDFKSKYETWGARVKTNSHTGSSANQYGPYDYTYYNNAGMWQYSFYDYEYDGIGLDMLDVNVCYKDYPTIMETYGYNNCEVAKPSLVSGKTPITSSGSALGTVDNYTASLTDGKAAGISSIDTAGSWFIIKNGVNTASAGYAEIIFDLGARYDITGASLHLGNLTDYGIGSPWGLNIAVSDSLTGEYTAYGTYFPVNKTDSSVSSANNKLAYWSELENISGLTGRYVKISCTLGGNFFLLNEVKIYGEANTTPVTPPAEDDGNLVRGKDYTISGTNAPASNSVYTADLTDGAAYGAIDDTLWNGNVWFALKNTEHCNELGYAHLTFDLGEKYDINKVRLHLGNNASMGINMPTEIIVEVSDTGADGSYVEYGTMVPTQSVDGAYWAELDIENLSGRYVRIGVYVIGTWAFLNEVEVYGSVYTEPEVHVHTPGAEADCENAQTCTECGEVIAEALGHTPGAEADCENAQTCTVCGDVLAEALGHTPGEWVVVIEPTASAEGYQEQSCTECGKVVAAEDIPMLTLTFVRGDVDGNGEIKTADYIILKRILLGVKDMGTLKYPETAFDRCDINANGEVKTNDYILLKRYLLGMYKIAE